MAYDIRIACTVTRIQRGKSSRSTCALQKETKEEEKAHIANQYYKFSESHRQLIPRRVLNPGGVHHGPAKAFAPRRPYFYLL